MLGFGGIFVEILKDVVFGLAPLEREEAAWMIKQLRAYPLLRGYRGRGPFDTDSLIRLIVAVSEMMAKGNIKEIDLNPVILYPKGATVVDGKMKI
jgi:acyl-CoA synthetase (NDP forming)